MSGRDELDRPTTFLAAGGFAAALPAVIYLHDLTASGPRRLEWYAALGLAIFATYLGLAHGGRGLLFAIVAIASAAIEVWSKWRAANPPPPPAPPSLPPRAPEKVEVIRRLGGMTHGKPHPIEMVEFRTARWVRWQEFGRTVLDWAEVLNGVHGALLVGEPIMGHPRAFGKDTKAWVDGTNGLDTAGLVKPKVIGVPVRLAHSVSVCRDKIAGGKLAWPEDRDPPRINPPTGLMTVEGYPPTPLASADHAPQVAQSQS